MKHIVKEDEPQAFIDWKNKANDNWIPTYNKLSGDEKVAVFKSLLEEQGCLCCYCERELSNNDYHIEHIKPKDQEKFPELQLVYLNLLCSCQRNTKKGTPIHCGNSKDNWYDEDRFVSPLNPDCETKFKYTWDGQILPADENDRSAKTTIEKLKLDIDKLNKLRENAIEPFLNLDNSLSQDDLDSFVQGYLIDKNLNEGKFSEFFTTVKYLFGT